MSKLKPARWQQHPLTLITAVILGVGPLYAIVIWSGFASLRNPALRATDVESTLLTLLLVVIGFGGLILIVLRLLNGENLSDLDLKKQTAWLDLTHGLLLVLPLIFSQLLLGIIARFFTIPDISESNRLLAHALAGDSTLLLVWLGPVIWLQAGVFEEFTRVFMLSRLWKVWSGPKARYLVLLASSLLFGLGHINQGTFGILGTMLIGFVLGYYYMKSGRVLPLIISHALYDTTVIVMLVYAAKMGMI